MTKNNVSTDLGAYLKLILHPLPDSLVSQAYKDRLLQIAKNLPVLRHGIIELRELPYSPQTDLMVCVFHDLEAKLLHSCLEGIDGKNPNWSLVKKLCTLWTDERHLISGVLDNIYLVFDNIDLNAPVPDPWIYLAFRKLHLEASIQIDLFQYGAKLLDKEITKQQAEILLQIMPVLPESAWIFGFGFLHARGFDTMRIGICGFRNREEITNFLEMIPWEGSTIRLLEETKLLADYPGAYVLAIDLEEKILPRIGIECVLEKSTNKTTAEMLFREIGSHRLDPKRSSAILDWIVDDDIILYGTKLRMQRWLNHIKVIYEPDHPISLKPYLYYNFIPL